MPARTVSRFVGPLAGLLGLLLTAAAAAPAGAVLPASAGAVLPAAPTFTVNITADVAASLPLASGPCETAPGNGLCSLRAAIMKANHFPGGGATIVLPALPAGQAYVLALPPSGADDEATGDLNISTTLSLLGGGASLTIIDGHGNILHDRVFNIEAGAHASLSGLTIQRGHAAGNGGGVYVAGALRLADSAVLSNTADSAGLGGGGLFSFGALTVTHSLIADNQTLADGGGGLAAEGGSVWLANDTLSGNQAPANGGGIENGALLQVYSSTLSLNRAGGFGGGLDSNGSARLRDSALLSNTADQGGGAVNFGTLTLVNTTVSSNRAARNGGGLANVCGCASSITLFNTTVAGNQADADFNGTGLGGGIYNFNNPSTVTQLQNSLLAENFESLFITNFGYIPWANACRGAVGSLDDNLLTTTAGCGYLAAAHDHTNVAAPLAPLANNGGPTWTQALLPGNPAIDAGNNVVGCRDNLGALLPADQRGRPRTANGAGAGATRCDIGAFELQRTLALPLVRR